MGCIVDLVIRANIANKAYAGNAKKNIIKQIVVINRTNGKRNNYYERRINMFYTEMESVENGYILKVGFNLSLKKYIYRSLEDLRKQRHRIEMLHYDGNFEQLIEELK